MDIKSINGWPAVLHISGSGTSHNVLLEPPGGGLSHYITSLSLLKSTANDTVRILRRACLEFNSAADAITVADAASLQPGTNDFIIGFWYRYVSGTATNITLLNKMTGGLNGYTLDVSSGVFRALIGAGPTNLGGATSSVAYNADTEWHLLWMRVDRDGGATGIKLYRDSTLIASGSTAALVGDSVTGSTANLTMTGAASVVFRIGPVFYLSGADLSGDAYAVHQYYNTGMGRKFGTSADPMAGRAWNVDEGTGTVAYDSTGVGNGTIANAAWVSNDGPPKVAYKEALSWVGPIQSDGDIITLDFDGGIPLGPGSPLQLLVTTGGAAEFLVTGFTDGI